MNTYVIFNTEDGKVSSCHSCDSVDSVLPLVLDGQSYIDITDAGIPNTQDIFNYFVNKDLALEPLPPDPTAQWVLVRTRRNGLLLASDWTDTYSAPARLGQELYAAWQDYRQALRDVTDQPDPFNIVWPTPPQ